MTIAKIYGEVVWVDKPMTSLRDLSKFDVLNLDETMQEISKDISQKVS